MEYTLVKELKDAGFPQEKKQGFTLFPNDGIHVEVYVPTLAELIEACGEGMFSLTRHGSIWQTNWRDGMAGETAGKTPTEAVARLWLSLHTKQGK